MAQSRRQEEAGVREVSPRGKAWGNVARRGAANIKDGGRASEAWRAAGDAARTQRDGRGRREPLRSAGEDEVVVVPANLVEETEVLRVDEGIDREELGWEPEEWIDEGRVRDEAQGAVQRGRNKTGPRSPEKRWSPMDGARDDEAEEAEKDRHDGETLVAELRNAVGASKAPRFEQRMKDAGEAFRRGRYEDARKILRPMSEQAPRVAALRELYGLTLYRLGRWKAASGELEAFRTLTGGVDQNPVLADCYRALGRHEEVEELWAELSAASPSGALVAEGRIVAAGDLADQGRINEAIKLLEPGLRPARRAKDHHLRVAYALADLYERAGDMPRARELFQRVAGSEPEFVDVQARLQALD